jgi:hypothetical protein
VRRLVLLTLLTAAAVVACSDDEPSTKDDVETSHNHADHVNLMNDFVPGDPNFKRNPALNVENVSKHDETRSHTRSKNCQTCHQEAGPGRGIFTISGTVLDEEHRPYPNAILQIFETVQAPGGGPVAWGGPVEVLNLAMEIEVDGNGNFFTTQELPDFFPDKPIYPRFVTADRQPLYKELGLFEATMGGGVSVGGCNFCHSETFPIIARLEPNVPSSSLGSDAGITDVETLFDVGFPTGLDAAITTGDSHSADITLDGSRNSDVEHDAAPDDE